MGLKFNGVYETCLRWYNTDTGEVKQVPYEFKESSEIEFSRKILKTKPMTMSIHPDHTPDPQGFWWFGYQADKDQRITFQTGTKNRIVISKNKTDFLFCSTNQSFRSCFALGTGGPNQLLKLHETPGIYIAYVTQEDGEYVYDMIKYIHPKMSGRAFVYISDRSGAVCVGRPYGKNGFELRDAIRRFTPSGLSVNWELSEEQRAVQGIEYDNFRNGRAIHDKYDGVFDKSLLYPMNDVITLIGDDHE